ncbi:molybdopterin converting factor subunit 1 [Zavarzinia sp. CC-PAN008]|uniref:molybdopterin converting factor subunit 1 n=1 Tax=Zavarzinia sp. CC-PAN008 TaxID=3243332 RepID=UPI003F7455E0
MKLVYFAWVRERIGMAQESYDLQPGQATVADVVGALRARGGGYEAALGDPTAVRFAVNQDHAKADHPVTQDDELAIFPPVTGG